MNPSYSHSFAKRTFSQSLKCVYAHVKHARANAKKFSTEARFSILNFSHLFVRLSLTDAFIHNEKLYALCAEPSNFSKEDAP